MASSPQFERHVGRGDAHWPGRKRNTSAQWNAGPLMRQLEPHSGHLKIDVDMMHPAFDEWTIVWSR